MATRSSRSKKVKEDFSSNLMQTTGPLRGWSHPKEAEDRGVGGLAQPRDRLRQHVRNHQRLGDYYQEAQGKASEGLHGGSFLGNGRKKTKGER